MFVKIRKLQLECNKNNIVRLQSITNSQMIVDYSWLAMWIVIQSQTDHISLANLQYTEHFYSITDII